MIKIKNQSYYFDSERRFRFRYNLLNQALMLLYIIFILIKHYYYTLSIVQDKMYILKLY